MDDPVTAGAGPLGPDVTNDPEVGGHVVQHLRHVLAQGLERAAAVGADQSVRLMNPHLARQVGRERARNRRGLGGGAGVGRLDSGSAFGHADFQLFQLQFELVEEPIRSLRPAAKLMAAEFGDPEL